MADDSLMTAKWVPRRPSTDLCRLLLIGPNARRGRSAKGDFVVIASEADNRAHYLFGHWRFEADTGDLSDAESTTRLEPQVGKLLEYFLTHQGQVISRDELIAEVWDNRVVSDDAINRCISILRQVLSPVDKSAYIETVTRRGYIARFPPPPQAQGSITQHPGRRRYLIPVSLAGIAAMLIYILAGKWTAIPDESPVRSRADPPVVAVLPFTASSHGGDGAFFATGVHDDLLTQLAQLQALRVISRTSVLGYRNAAKNLRDIGRELGADAILEGSVQTIDEQIRINVQLVDTSTDEHLWAATFDRELSPESLFAVQSEISRAIAEAMHTTLTAQDTARLAVLPTDNMAAYRAYHLAMAIRDADGVLDPGYASELERAVTLDPGFVRAWAELAGLLSFRYFIQPDSALVERVETMLERIRSLAPDSAEFLIAQAYYTYYVLKDYDPAFQLISRAQGLLPGDVRVIELQSWIERRLGNFPGRAESVRRARALDPLNPLWTRTLAWSLALDHRYDDASREIENAFVQDYALEVMGHMLRVRHHHDFERWAADVAMLQNEFGRNANALALWNALVASRNFQAAETLWRSMPDDIERIDGISLGNLADKDLHQVLTYWLLGQSDELHDVVHRLRETAALQQRDENQARPAGPILVSALLAAVDGDTQKTERLVRRWRRTTADDLAQLAAERHFSCRVLGMAAATAAAVECIRSALDEPSFVMPFIEPYLPYYDSIRDQTEFVKLLADLSQD